MLDLNNLAIFVQVVDAGSFADAARRMGIPPNTLSRRLTQLEDEVGSRLLHRSTRRLKLTDAGQSLYHRCELQLGELLEISRNINASDEPSGRVKVAAPADFFEVFMMSWVKEFLAKNPKVQLDFVLHDNRSDLIAEGIDVAFRAGRLPDSSLVARKIGIASQVMAASPKYLDIHGQPSSVETLTQHDCIRSSLAASQRSWTLIGPDGPVQVNINGQFCANTAMAQLKAAMMGLGICLLPEPILRDRLIQGDLIRVLPGYATPASNFSTVYPSRRHISAAVRAFVEHAVAYMHQETFKEDMSSS